MSGHTELADDEHVERRVEPSRHLEADGHAAARQREDDRGTPREAAKSFGEEAPRTSIVEFRGVPGGRYEISARLLGEGEESRAVARRMML